MRKLFQERTAVTSTIGKPMSERTFSFFLSNCIIVVWWRTPWKGSLFAFAAYGGFNRPVNLAGLVNGILCRLNWLAGRQGLRGGGAPMFANMLKTLLKLIPARFRKSTSVIHVVRLDGPIMAERGLRPTLSGKALEPVLKKAFRKGIAGVALAINCPGGSPVQSAIIARRIRELAAEHKIPVYAFCEDVAASGGYWLACAADEIYADENSIVGSIGVISMGFGFPEAIKKLGIERRVHTAGENKSQNDPFQPEKAEDVARLEGMLDEMHESFKALVRERRKGKLTGDEKVHFLR